MTRLAPQQISSTDAQYPPILKTRLGTETPARITAIGSLDVLAAPLTALFCSSRCPGNAILNAASIARNWRDEGRGVISGFHSPVEKECLRILLRGKQPIIICPARSIDGMRIPAEWRPAIESGRMLLLSPFPAKTRRPTTALCEQRNQFAAALANAYYFPHARSGGHLETLAAQMDD
ncbi:MAG: DNA-processing protein DprA [Verrucomicrobia bacterium]|nr:DNA-processing protein DprA [Verrucomicrobiota bacterium]